MNQNDNTEGDTLYTTSRSREWNYPWSRNLDTDNPMLEKFWIEVRNVNLSE